MSTQLPHHNVHVFLFLLKVVTFLLRCNQSPGSCAYPIALTGETAQVTIEASATEASEIYWAIWPTDSTDGLGSVPFSEANLSACATHSIPAADITKCRKTSSKADPSKLRCDSVTFECATACQVTWDRTWESSACCGRNTQPVQVPLKVIDGGFFQSLCFPCINLLYRYYFTYYCIVPTS